MVKALLALVGVLRSAWLIELVGAALIVAGVHEAWGVAAALIVAGGMLVLKAFELDARGDG
jgi:uncharacterized membrane protein YecN with MAPEG domain